MASERDFELLDDYIGNRLDKGERESFEGKLQADPELQRELKLQQGIIESLRKARAAELKSMLNNVPLSAIPGESSSMARWAGISVVLLVAIGLYFYLKPVQQEQAAPPTESVTVTPPVSETEGDKEVLSTEEPATQDAAPDTKSPANDVTKTTKPAASEKASETPKSPEINVYEPEQETETETAPEVNISKASKIEPASSDISTEIVSTNKNYTFHYQFKDDKLILYGAFDKNLYEIMEFISEEKRTIFLHYKNNFYLLNQSGEKVKPLSPVNDPVLIRKLTEQRGQ
jgi:hypothetical protein